MKFQSGRAISLPSRETGVKGSGGAVWQIFGNKHQSFVQCAPTLRRPLGHTRGATSAYIGATMPESSLPTAVEAPPVAAERLTAYFQIGVFVSLVIVLYWYVLFDLGRDWWNIPNLSQGFLIPPLAAYIAWLRRSNIAAARVQPDSRGLLLIAFACVSYIVGRLGSEFFLPRISFVILLAGIVWTFWGTIRLRLLTFPLLLLATMVPLPNIIYNTIAAPLQLFASEIAAWCAQALGVSVYRDGNIIQLAHISLGVEEACSGLNSLSALMVAGLILGFLECTRVRTRVLLFLLTFPLAVGINVFRVTGTAVLADYREEFAMGFYHSFAGWLVFVSGFVILYQISRMFHRYLD